LNYPEHTKKGIIRFNEAGAIKPRKTSGLVSVSVPDLDCFNEAGAIKPRKTLKAFDWMKKNLDASMRPGQSSPGKR